MACTRPRPRCKKGLCRECGPAPKAEPAKPAGGKGKKAKED